MVFYFLCLTQHSVKTFFSPGCSPSFNLISYNLFTYNFCDVVTAYCSQKSQDGHEEIKCKYLGEVENNFVIYLVTSEVLQLVSKAASSLEQFQNCVLPLNQCCGHS